jgi:hypothetical protein
MRTRLSFGGTCGAQPTPRKAMLSGAFGIAVAVALLWVATQFFGGRFSTFPYSGAQGCLAVAIAMILLLAIYVFSMPV